MNGICNHFCGFISTMCQFFAEELWQTKKVISRKYDNNRLQAQVKFTLAAYPLH